jgi:methylmalonyl-CoA carboxyltransferase small subunit
LKLQITINGKAYEVEVEALEDDESPRQPGYAAYQPAPAAFQTAPAAGVPQQAQPHAGQINVCLSPVTGLVIKVHVEPGQRVEPNDPIMVLEAMKMETHVVAPQAGTVKTVHVAPGDSVKLNQILVEFE